MITQRAYIGADTAIVHWVRDDAGKRDLTGDTLTVDVYGYGVPIKLFTLDASSTEAGKVAFTIPQDKTEAYMSAGSYRYAVMAGSEVVAGGLVEMV